MNQLPEPGNEAANRTSSQPAGDADDRTQPERRKRSPEWVQPSIFIADLAAYNDGLLRGVWTNPALGVEHLREAARTLLASSPVPRAEEIAIHDYEGFHGMPLDEHADLATVAAIAEGIDRFGIPFAAWAERVGIVAAAHDLTDNQAQQFQADYLGEHDSVAAFAEEYADDCGIEQMLDQHLPSGVRGYVQIDYQMLGQDLQLGGDIWVTRRPAGGVWVFWT
jgi:antirestriction protein